jgi:transcriptional regulator with XRE-family HTH domain
MTTQRTKNIADQLKSAIRKSGNTHYRIAKESGISEPMLSRFMAGERDLRLESAAKVARSLGLELASVAKKKGARNGKTHSDD